MPFEIVKTDNMVLLGRSARQEIAPPQVSAEVLRKMKKTAEDYSAGSPRAVHPGAGLLQRLAAAGDRDAGRIAGLEVSASSTAAAALAFGMDKQSSKDKKIAVYDLGGGTFDILDHRIADVDGESSSALHQRRHLPRRRRLRPAPDRPHHRRIQEGCRVDLAKD